MFKAARCRHFCLTKSGSVFTTAKFSFFAITKLKGQLKDGWSFSIERDLRIIVDLKDAEKILFVDIGNRDQAY